MIITEYVEVTMVSTNIKYYRRIYGEGLKLRNIVKVHISDLPSNSNKNIKCLCDQCNDDFERSYQNLMKQKLHLCYPCSRKRVGKIMDTSNTIKATRSRCGSKHPRWNPNKDELAKYKSKVQTLTKNTYKVYKGLINPNDYPRTLCGVDGGYQLDHIISIKEGFEKNIPPYTIAHVNNLQMLPWKDNRSKGSLR